MKRSTKRILTTHAGSLPRPDDVKALISAKAAGQPYDREALARRLPGAVAEVVRQQVASGIDSVNDGELSKPNFTDYVRERISGFEVLPPDRRPAPQLIFGRDVESFPEYFAGRTGFRGAGQNPVLCTGPIRYIGANAIRNDVENFRAALRGVEVEEAYLPAVAPGTIEHWLRNEHYPTDEAYLFAIADAMREEYRAIVDAGFVLQIDDPDLADAWQIYPRMSVGEYRKFAELRVDALNHALRDISPDRVRFHMCWGSYHGPHRFNIPLRDIVDLILKVRADAYSIEASNRRGPDSLLARAPSAALDAKETS